MILRLGLRSLATPRLAFLPQSLLRLLPIRPFSSTPTVLRQPGGRKMHRREKTFSKKDIVPKPTHAESAAEKRGFSPLPTYPVNPDPAARAIPNLSYWVSRSKQNLLPVYTIIKQGGSRKQTRIRHVRGDSKVLAQELSEKLGLPLKPIEGIWVSQVTGHVMAKGHHAEEIMKHLAEKGF